MTLLQAPFPWFGGKSRAADAIWRRLGDVPNYVEPFFGSGAVLLRRPHPPGIETVNDQDRYIANFWRAVQADPEAVARFADWPVNETDLEARHAWLVNEGREKLSRGAGDPRWYDAEIAGWWVWGISTWIGGHWCAERPGGWHWSEEVGWHVAGGGNGVYRQRPHLAPGRGVHKREPLVAWMLALSARLRRVRVCCGDWRRVLGPMPTRGLTGVLLDPPYSVADRAAVYSHDDRDVARDVRAWCLEHGDDPTLRIALCGYEGEHEMPRSWSVHEWSATGGYANLGSAIGINAKRERVWFSPHCLPERVQRPLFGEGGP